jgi:hypothetical protein
VKRAASKSKPAHAAETSEATPVETSSKAEADSI